MDKDIAKQRMDNGGSGLSTWMYKMPQVKIKKVAENAIIPTKGSKYAAGFDLYATEDTEIWIGETKVIGSGIAIEIPEGFFGAVFSRSGLSTKRGLAVINGVGVIDSDYRGEIKVPLHNHGNKKEIIKSGERIAQLVLIRYHEYEWLEVDSLEDSARGVCGFGSSGRY